MARHIDSEMDNGKGLLPGKAALISIKFARIAKFTVAIWKEFEGKFCAYAARMRSSIHTNTWRRVAGEQTWSRRAAAGLTFIMLMDHHQTLASSSNNNNNSNQCANN